MNTFTIFTLGEPLDLTELRLALMAFARLGEQVTPKHRKKIRLALFFSKEQEEALGAILPGHSMEKQVAKVRPDQLEEAEKLFEDSSLFFLPSKNKHEDLIQDVMALGLPVITFKTSKNQKLIDNTCGLLVEEGVVDPASEFAKLFRMLYFDQAACEIMKQGAEKKAYRSKQNFSLSPSHLLSA